MSEPAFKKGQHVIIDKQYLGKVKRLIGKDKPRYDVEHLRSIEDKSYRCDIVPAAVLEPYVREEGAEHFIGDRFSYQGASITIMGGVIRDGKWYMLCKTYENQHTPDLKTGMRELSLFEIDMFIKGALNLSAPPLVIPEHSAATEDSTVTEPAPAEEMKPEIDELTQLRAENLRLKSAVEKAEADAKRAKMSYTEADDLKRKNDILTQRLTQAETSVQRLLNPTRKQYEVRTLVQELPGRAEIVRLQDGDFASELNEGWTLVDCTVLSDGDGGFNRVLTLVRECPPAAEQPIPEAAQAQPTIIMSEDEQAAAEKTPVAAQLKFRTAAEIKQEMNERAYQPMHEAAAAIQEKRASAPVTNPLFAYLPPGHTKRASA